MQFIHLNIQTRILRAQDMYIISIVLTTKVLEQPTLLM